MADVRRVPRLRQGQPRQDQLRNGRGGHRFCQIVMAHVGKQLGIDWVHVPFKEGASGTALLGGFIQAVADPAFWAPLVRSGQFRLLVTFGPKRTTSWPTVPTLEESGHRYRRRRALWDCGSAPHGSEDRREPAGRVRAGLEDPAFAATLTRFNEEPFYLNSDQFHDFAVSQISKEKRLVEELGMLGTMGE